MTESARHIARLLLQAGVLKISINNLFTWTSGIKSPIYCNLRDLLALPQYRDAIKSELCRLVFEKFPDIDGIAGVSTAGIPWSALIADTLKLPMVYVRAEPKKHGLKNQVEGRISAGQKLIVLDDVIATGYSTGLVVDCLRSQGILVEAIVGIYFYELPESIDYFNKLNVPVEAISNYQALKEEAVHQGLINATELDFLNQWIIDPRKA